MGGHGPGMDSSLSKWFSFYQFEIRILHVYIPLLAGSGIGARDWTSLRGSGERRMDGFTGRHAGCSGEASGAAIDRTCRRWELSIPTARGGQEDDARMARDRLRMLEMGFQQAQAIDGKEWRCDGSDKHGTPSLAFAKV